MIYRDIMNASSEDKQLFYRLIKIQREGKTRKLSKLIIDDLHLQEDDKIREGWATYFTNLSMAKNDPNFDIDYKYHVDSDIAIIEELAAAESDRSIELNLENLGKIIYEMKNGKSPDGDGIMSEHLKYGGNLLLECLIKLFRKIIEEKENTRAI